MSWYLPLQIASVDSQINEVLQDLSNGVYGVQSVTALTGLSNAGTSLNVQLNNTGVVDISAGTGINITGTKNTSLVISAPTAQDISAGSNIVVTDTGQATRIDLSSTVVISGPLTANSLTISGNISLTENNNIQLGLVGIGNIIQGQNQGGIGSIYHYADNTHSFWTKNSLGNANASFVVAGSGSGGNPGILVNGDQPGQPRGIVNCGSVLIDNDIKKTEDGGISFVSILKAIPLMFGRQAAGGQNNLYYPEAYTGKGNYVNASRVFGWIDSLWLAPHVHVITYGGINGTGAVQNDFHNTNDYWTSFAVGGTGYNSYELYFET